MAIVFNPELKIKHETWMNPQSPYYKMMELGIELTLENQHFQQCVQRHRAQLPSASAALEE